MSNFPHFYHRISLISYCFLSFFPKKNFFLLFSFFFPKECFFLRQFIIIIAIFVVEIRFSIKLPANKLYHHHDSSSSILPPLPTHDQLWYWRHLLSFLILLSLSISLLAFCSLFFAKKFFPLFFSHSCIYDCSSSTHESSADILYNFISLSFLRSASLLLSLIFNNKES